MELKGAEVLCEVQHAYHSNVLLPPGYRRL